MSKYHISDDGTPGLCKAQSTDSCPKTQGGDSFHGTFEEAQLESEKRFADEHGNFATQSKGSAKSQPKPAPIKFVNTGSIHAALFKTTYGPDYQNGHKTLGDAMRAQELAGEEIETTPMTQSVSRDLALDIATLSKRDQDYFIEKVPSEDFRLFSGTNSGLGMGNMKALVKVHRALVEKHGTAQPKLRIEDQLPEGSTSNLRYDGDREGIGSLRTWGEPSNSIQNMNDETGRMLAQHVIDRYGAKNAEKFWSEASATNGPRSPRAKLSKVFSTMRKFDKEQGIKG